MRGVRMVPVLKVTNAFHARVIAARLGSEGIVTQFRGGIDTPYPMGHVEVLVDADDLETAREILLADDIESAFDDVDGIDDLDGDDEGEGTVRLAPWVVAVVLLVLVAVASVNTLGYRL